MAEVKQALEKKVNGMRSQTMSFANDGIEVSLSIPDTHDVKEAFGTVIETVVEQHEDIGKLNSDITKVSQEGRNSRKKIAEVTTQKLKQVLNYQLKLEQQLQAAQRQIRNFAYNIQGYVDENDEETSVMGNRWNVLRDIEVHAGDIGGEEGGAQQNALFPTEEGAIPQDHISFQKVGEGGPARVKQKKKSLSLSVIDYHKIPPFILPKDTKARWRWAIRKTMQMIRRKKMKISFTRTRIDKTQTVAARLDALDRDLCQLPEIVDTKIQASVDAVVNNMNLHLQQLRDDLDSKEMKAFEKAESQDRRLEALEHIINSMQNQQDGKLEELETKHNQFAEQVNAQLAGLSKTIKDMISLNMYSLKRSLNSIHENLSSIDQQAQQLLKQIQENRSKSSDEPDPSALLNSLLQDNSSIQDLQSQVSVVEGATTMMESSLQNISHEIFSLHDHYDRNLGIIEPTDLNNLHDLLKTAKSYGNRLDGVRESILAMKRLMGHHHEALQKVVSEVVSNSLNSLSALPKLKVELEEVKCSQSDLKYALAASDEEKRDLRSDIEELLHKLEDLERVAHDHADALDRTRSMIESTTAAAIEQVSKAMRSTAVPQEQLKIISSQQSGHAGTIPVLERELGSDVSSGNILRVVTASDDNQNNSNSRPPSARPLSARPSSERISSRPQSSKRERVNKFDDSPRDLSVHQTPRRRIPSGDGMGAITRDIAGLRAQLDSLKDLVTKQLLKDKNSLEGMVAATGTGHDTNDGDDSLFDNSAMFTLLFPEEKISQKIQNMLQDLLPEYLSNYVSELQSSRHYIGIAEDRSSSKQQRSTVSQRLPSAQDTPEFYVQPDNRVSNSASSKHRAAAAANRPLSAQDMSESINKAVQRVSSTGESLSMKIREFGRSNSSDSNNKRLIGSFVDYNASQSLLKAPLPSDGQILPSNFDSSPLIADIASIRSENMSLQRRIEEIEDDKLNETRVRELLEGMLREHRRRDNKADYKAMVEDMDVTVRDLVKELLNVKRNHENNIAKLRQDFEAALGKALHSSSIVDDSNADAVVSTKAICLGCGRGSHVRVEAASRPTSPSFLPQLSTHSVPGPDIYRGGFRMPVRSSSPPIGTGEIPILMRGKVETSKYSRGDESVDLAPSVASIQIPQTAKLSSIPSPMDDSSVVLKVGFHDDDFGLQSVTSNIVDSSHEMGFERPPNSNELPRIHSAGGGVVRTAPNKNDNDTLRPIFRKGFPGKKSLKAETTYAPERFDLTVSAYPVMKSVKNNGKHVLSASLNSLQ